MKLALVSVDNKNGIVELAKRLIALDWTIISTGNTAKKLREEGGVHVIDIATFTGAPEGLDDRVKTLSTKVSAALLADLTKPHHVGYLVKLGVHPIDLLVGGLYDFEGAIKDNLPFDACIGKIDVGGPTMIRAAAKNHARVTVISSPEQYEQVLMELEQMGGTTPETRLKLARDVFRATSRFDGMVAERLDEELAKERPAA